MPSLVMAAFNLFLPVIFELLCRAEQWSTPLFVIQISVVRLVSKCEHIVSRVASLSSFVSSCNEIQCRHIIDPAVLCRLHLCLRPTPERY